MSPQNHYKPCYTGVKICYYYIYPTLVIGKIYMNYLAVGLHLQPMQRLRFSNWHNQGLVVRLAVPRCKDRQAII